MAMGGNVRMCQKVMLAMSDWDFSVFTASFPSNRKFWTTLCWDWHASTERAPISIGLGKLVGNILAKGYTPLKGSSSVVVQWQFYTLDDVYVIAGLLGKPSSAFHKTWFWAAWPHSKWLRAVLVERWDAQIFLIHWMTSLTLKFLNCIHMNALEWSNDGFTEKVDQTQERAGIGRAQLSLNSLLDWEF